MKGGASNSEGRAGSCHSGEPEPEPHVEQDEGAALQWTTTGSRVVPSAARKPYRLLALEGEKGAVFCRVHDELSRSRLPHLSEHGTLEFATRSLLRMFNLTVFRISERRASMVGPGDYYGNVEAPHAHSHTVTLGGPDETPPVFVPHPIEQAAQPVRGRPVSHADVVRARAAWISSKTPAGEVAMQAAKEEYSARGVEPFGGSLFPDPGLLELDFAAAAGATADGPIELPCVDATALDLAEGFGARLVRNDEPFRITEEELPTKDEYRPVSYEFGEEYATRCIEEGGGLFLETHDFTQTMTPLDAHACGFITLGRWVSDADDANSEHSDHAAGESETPPAAVRQGTLELIAVRIPYGYTLLVDKGCMHGDTTFRGLYMMGMTSNHVTMSTADTVFLKHASTKRNVRLTCPEHDRPGAESLGAPYAPRPIVVYADPTQKELDRFAAATDGADFMLQPFSAQSIKTTLFRRLGWYPGGAVQ